MAKEKIDNIITRLKNGEKIVCSKCKKGYFVPFNTTPDKAHCFDCSNPECDNYVHFDPIIEID